MRTINYKNQGVYIRKNPIVFNGRTDFSKFSDVIRIASSNGSRYGFNYNSIYEDTCMGQNLNRSKISSVELKEKYISLADALKDAEFVNRKFRRTSYYTKSGDLRFTASSNAVLVAVLKDGRAIIDDLDRSCSAVMQTNKRVPAFYLVNPEFLNDKNYELGEEVNDAHYTAENVYQTIDSRPYKLSYMISCGLEDEDQYGEEFSVQQL